MHELNDPVRALRRCEDETFEETLARFLRDGK